MDLNARLFEPLNRLQKLTEDALEQNGNLAILFITTNL
jgi:hypothetical protein